MIKNIFFLLVVLALGSSSAQSFKININPFQSESKQIKSAQDTLKILAVMVNFQTDRDAATFGDGKFGSIYTQNYGTSIIDPLPHDKSYFEAHLEFVKNYFTKVSNGHQKISYTVLPDTLSVSQAMRNYSPAVNSDDFSNLAKFSEEVWNLTVQQYPDFNFSDYDLFTIFHAGVGRDVTLPGSLGNERDLPSVYLSLNTLRDIYNNQSFSGYPAPGGFNITNSLIMPETESREVSASNQTFLFEISINGLLVASVASHLGLPDLFDTETGLSAIGKFGLMDGQSIFAYNGLFPPEPSAWEKVFLGWADTTTVPVSSSAYNASVGIQDIVKVPINSTEYYLVENRLRDYEGNGAIVTYLNEGQLLTKTFPKDTSGFNTIDIDSLSGVIVNVDDFDWALPGNGVLIWHIDENIIQSKIDENKINTDKEKRGVDMEEADGIQDIGEKFFNIFGEEVIAEGSEDDFWFAGNISKLYRNRFAADTRPNTNSNSRANSLISFTNFSPISNPATFTVTYGDSIVKPLASYKLPITGSVKSLSRSSISSLKLETLIDSSLYRLTSEGTVLIAPDFSNLKPALFTLNGNDYSIGTIGNRINVYSHSDNRLFTIQLAASEVITAPAVVQKSVDNIMRFAVGTSTGKLFIYNFNSFNDIVLVDTSEMENGAVKKIASRPGKFFALNVAGLTDFYPYEDPQPHPNYNIPAGDMTFKDVALVAGEPIILSNESINVVNSHSLKPEGLENISRLVLADLKNDGNNYIVYNNGPRLEAINMQGASAESFPFIDPLGIGFTGTPLAVDFEGDGKSEVVAYTLDGRIFAIDGGSGKIIPGFPLSTGAELASTPVMFNYFGSVSLAGIDKQNNFYSWIIGAALGTFTWAEENGNAQNTSAVEMAKSDNLVSEFFPELRIYNYPNPVYEPQTAIRYYVSEDSKINIKIFDLAGDFVAEMNNTALGGLDGETLWNVSNIQSGVYLARVEAVSISGKTESKIIKIAIVK